MSSTPHSQPLGLDNCATEPIHIPGHIQPHGALLAFDAAAALRGWSANAAALLGIVPAPGQQAETLGLAEEALALVVGCLAELAEDEVPPTAAEVRMAGRIFDCVVHGAHGRVIAEFELRSQSSDEVAAFALKAHSAIDKIKRQKTIPALLQLAVEQVAAITGFDRVMAYRFRHDDSGDVVAEAVREGLPPYLGMRYPASDIPAQARRLYTINTLRLIADIGYQPVAVHSMAGEAPLDMSHCILRSVSPIHVEYLQNMGVGASMSVSIVVNGRLWGLIACHHMAPMQVPYSIRMACDVVAQVLAATVQSLDARERAALTEQAAGMRTHLIETLLHEEDVLAALTQHADSVAASLSAEALVFSQQGKLHVHGPLPHAVAAAIVASLPSGGDELLQRSRRDAWPEAMRCQIGPWVGLLGLYFDPATEGWLLALRQEQVETVRWGGKPEKEIRTGPLGPRLTPRGSFDEWRDVVRDTAEPWSSAHLLVADQLLGEMHRASMMRHAEMERARMQLLAMLGHDLRDPLQSIRMAASVLKHGGEGQPLGQRIERSSGRMQRLISQVLDMSRLENGLGLALHLQPVDISRMAEDLLDESRTAHPGVDYRAAIAPDVTIDADADRLAQVVSNLLSNARHHGRAGEAVLLIVERDAAHVLLEVRNHGEPIADDLVAQLFNPFKRMALHNPANRTGMGLGLYIAANIVQGHGGTIGYHYEAPHVVFRVVLPAPAQAE
jgi:light-regulated signal transduction histidine kinase (bacteriophytochrome)